MTKINTAHASTPVRILVVDDEKNIRELFLALISLHLPKSRIDVAVNGTEAVELFRQTRPDIILMDIMMPVMNGEKAFVEIKRICSENKWQMPSVIFCTGYAPSDLIDMILKEDPRHCLLTKPVTNANLLKVIQERMPV
jgi:CheY-like chemotaxis protein